MIYSVDCIRCEPVSKMEQAEIDEIEWTNLTPEMNDKEFEQLLGFELLEKNEITSSVMKRMKKLVKADLGEGNEEASQCACKVINDSKCNSYDCPNYGTLVECPASCGDKCRNSPFRKNLWKTKFKLSTFFGKGFGLLVMESVDEGEYILNFVGQVFHTAYDRFRPSRYVCNFNIPQVTDKLCIDLSKKGGLCRFISHSHEPNCIVQTYYANGEYHNVLIAKQSIKPGTELTWDYRERFKDVGIEVCFCFSEKYCPDFNKATKIRDDAVRGLTVRLCVTEKVSYKKNENKMMIKAIQSSHQGDDKQAATTSYILSSKDFSKSDAAYDENEIRSQNPDSTSFTCSAPRNTLPYLATTCNSLDQTETKTTSVPYSSGSDIMEKKIKANRKRKLCEGLREGTKSCVNIKASKPRPVVNPVNATPLTPRFTRSLTKTLAKPNEHNKPASTDATFPVVEITDREISSGSCSNAPTKNGKGIQRKKIKGKHYCMICKPPKYFSFTGNRTKHMQRNHNAGPGYPCNYCKEIKLFKTKQELKKHLETHQSMKNRPMYRCNGCKEKYARREYCKNHQKNLSNINPYGLVPGNTSTSLVTATAFIQFTI